MDAELRALVSRTVTDFGQNGARSEVCFAHGAVLTVDWPHRFERLDPVRGLRDLVGQRLVSLSFGREQAILEFSAGAKLTVLAGEEGSSGLTLSTRRGGVVEWRPHISEAAA